MNDWLTNEIGPGRVVLARAFIIIYYREEMLQILFVPWLIDLTWLMIDWLIDVVEHWDYAFNVWGRRQCGWGGWMRCCHSWWWRFALLPVSSFRQPMIMFDCFVGLYKWCCVGESKNYKSVWIQCEKGQPRSSSKLNKKERKESKPAHTKEGKNRNDSNIQWYTHHFPLPVFYYLYLYCFGNWTRWCDVTVGERSPGNSSSSSSSCRGGS